MVTPLQSLRLPIGHPLVEILCKLSLESKNKDKDKPAFNEESPIHFKKEVSEEDKIKFKQALRVLHAIVNNEASLRYLSDENQKFIEDLAQAEKITNELVEKTLEIISYSDVDVDFEAFENAMLEVDKTAAGLKSYSQSQLLDLDGRYWDLEAPSSSKESITFRFDNLPKDSNGKEENFYARSSLKDLDKTGIIAIDFGTKNTTAIYMNKNGRYCLLSIGGDVDADGLEKYENPTIVEFRRKEKFLKDYNALSHRPFTKHNDIEVAHEAQKELTDPRTKGNDLYRFFSKLKQWAGADEKPCMYAISALKSYGFDKTAKLDKPIYYGVFDFGGGTTDFDFGKWEKSANPKFAYKMTHFSSGGDKYLGGENLLELLAFEAYAKNFQTLKEKDIVIAKPNYDGIDEQRFRSFMQKSSGVRLNLKTIASNLRGFLENLDAHIIEAIEENEEFEIGDLKKDFSKNRLFDRNEKEVEEIELKIDCKELLELLKSKMDDGVANFFAGFSKVMAENIDNQCRAFHIFLGGNASKSVLVKQAFENAKEKQLKATSKWLLKMILHSFFMSR